jgi:hypothetical protein
MMAAKFSNLEKQREAQREVAYRKQVYDRLISAQRMSRQDADRKIAIMQEIADEYRELVKAERLI